MTEASAGGTQALAVLQKEAQKAGIARPLEDHGVGGQSFDGDLSHDDVIQEPLPFCHFFKSTCSFIKASRRVYLWCSDSLVCGIGF